ncbi:MAG: hypothetical protein AAGD33_03420 [Actinomycetota bacterium]
MRWFRRRRSGGDDDAPRLDLNRPEVHTPGTFIDSWFNMPGAQADDDDRPTVSDLHGRSGRT